MLITAVAFLSEMRYSYVRDWHWMIACSVYFGGMMTLWKELLQQHQQRLQSCHLLTLVMKMMTRKMSLLSWLTGYSLNDIYYFGISFVLTFLSIFVFILTNLYIHVSADHQEITHKGWPGNQLVLDLNHSKWTRFFLPHPCQKSLLLQVLVQLII